MSLTSKVLVGALAVLVMPVALAEAALFEEAFDSSAADVKVNVQSSDTVVRFVDYSSFTVGAAAHSIPEAPRPIAGGAPTRGILMQANLANGAAAAINVLAGATPINFSGDYRVSYDVYPSVSPNATAGETEVILWGLGTDDAPGLESRNQRTTAKGTFGWLATENGFGTEDAAIFEDDFELADLGDKQPGESGKFNAAFTTNFGGNNLPANSWVRVDVISQDGVVRVNFNGVRFFTANSAATSGFAMLGYEDPFGSISDQQDFQWGLFDNFVVASVPEPSSILLLGCSLLGVMGSRRRR